MKKYSGYIILGNLILFLGLFINAVVQKEDIIDEGQLILLELAPVDPRSLMQGDYMQLNYMVSGDVIVNRIPKRGYCVVTLDSDGVAKRDRFQKKNALKNENEYLIEYTVGEWNTVQIGAESYFFQEGEGEKYAEAKYGGVKVDEKGNSVLVGLYDSDRKKIE
ncbi:GDYXXLXY domain-containing protein [Muricauda sp. CAU 1633]|uniref:GDYXXLXY domain-containing protein n=1 Tax=Allomuricauda sp. CAU 1633 TaxID=2816036 RepID=UPI001A8F1D78|nr:GDYXXLXY domain-containing protein [Muricauda sp. CAU 1633]MBO0321027.1 GDYXXLXY domain-containing protein [Muricauda sp. CAU 1633]